MATKKITITLPEELVEAARELTDNLSGYAADALERKIRRTLLGLDLERYQQEHGRFDPEALAAARAALLGEDRPDASVGAA